MVIKERMLRDMKDWMVFSVTCPFLCVFRGGRLGSFFFISVFILFFIFYWTVPPMFNTLYGQKYGTPTHTGASITDHLKLVLAL